MTPAPGRPGDDTSTPPLTSAAQPWALPFPHPGHEVRARRFPVLAVEHELIEHGGVEALVTYLRIAVWHQRGEAYDVDRVARDIWWNDRNRAATWIEQLVRGGHLVRPAVRERPAQADPVEYRGAVWGGSWPPAATDGPTKGVPVVYIVWDDEDTVAYVGSTEQFPQRMRAHNESRRSLSWVRWEARECDSRAAAYVLEARAIDEHRPYQNRTDSTGKQL